MQFVYALINLLSSWPSCHGNKTRGDKESHCLWQSRSRPRRADGASVSDSASHLAASSTRWAQILGPRQCRGQVGVLQDPGFCPKILLQGYGTPAAPLGPGYGVAGGGLDAVPQPLNSPRNHAPARANLLISSRGVAAMPWELIVW